MLLRHVVRFSLHSSHYIYFGLVTISHILYSFDIYDNDVCVSLFISHVLFLFSLCTHVSSLYSLSIFQTWYLDSSCLVCFRKDKIKPSQDSKPSSCINFRGSNLLD